MQNSPEVNKFPKTGNCVCNSREGFGLRVTFFFKHAAELRQRLDNTPEICAHNVFTFYHVAHMAFIETGQRIDQIFPI